MFTNRNGCTIYEKTIQNRSSVFVRHVTGAVYWEDVKSQENGSDRSPKNQAFIVIPKNSADYVPKVGDKIFDSIITNETPPNTEITVMTVKNFCTIQHRPSLPCVKLADQKSTPSETSRESAMRSACAIRLFACCGVCQNDDLKLCGTERECAQ